MSEEDIHLKINLSEFIKLQDDLDIIIQLKKLIDQRFGELTDIK